MLGYLDQVQQDVVEHATVLVEGNGWLPEVLLQIVPRSFGRPAPGRRYSVNVIVDHSGHSGAPVVFEDNPTYDNLLGRIEHISQFGALVTDFSLIQERDETGEFPADTINRLVEARLADFAETLQAFTVAGYAPA